MVASPLRVLVVDDHLDTLVVFQKVLESAGQIVAAVSTFRSGRQHLQDFDVDLVFVDIGLADGNGLDLLRDLPRPLPFFAVSISGSETGENLSASRDAGFERHLVKPVRMKSVLEMIQLAALYRGRS